MPNWIVLCQKASWPTKDPAKERKFLIAKALLHEGKKIPVWVMNLNNYLIKVDKGSCLGCCSTVSSEVRQRQPITTSLNPLSRGLENFVDNVCQGLTVGQVRKFKDLMRRYQDIFEDGSKGGGTNIVQPRIDTGDARLIR